MTKTLTALAVTATLAIAAVAAPQPAQARDGAIAAGIIGGLAVGAIIGSAVAGPRDHGYYRHDRPEPHYYRPAPAYYRSAPAYYRADCYWTQQRVWNGYRWQLRRAQVCD